MYGVVITVPEVHHLGLAHVHYPGLDALQLSGVEHLELGGESWFVLMGVEPTEVAQEVTIIEEYKSCITDVRLHQKLPEYSLSI